MKITILCEPVAKGRPKAWLNKKAGRVMTYTPDKTAHAENLIRDKVCSLLAEAFAEKVPLTIDMWFFFSKPKSAPKKRLYPVVRPDWDNLGKLVTDALEKFAYKDDAQLIDVSTHKRYGDPPRIEIEIEELGKQNTIFGQYDIDKPGFEQKEEVN